MWHQLVMVSYSFKVHVFILFGSQGSRCFFYLWKNGFFNRWCFLFWWYLFFNLILDITDIDSDTEARLLASEEDENPLSVEKRFLRMDRCIKSFNFADINTSDYNKEVCRLIYTGFDNRSKLTSGHYLTFVDNFDRIGGKDCRRPQPRIDAWCLVWGKFREAFQVKKFLEEYPEVEGKLEEIRRRIDIIVKKKLI